MGVKLPDTVAACNMIKQIRHTNMKFKHKYIRIDFDNDEELYIRTEIVYYPPTGNVNIINGIRYRSLAFHPTTNRKLRCTNQHALEMLYYARAVKREYDRHKRRERI